MGQDFQIQQVQKKSESCPQRTLSRSSLEVTLRSRSIASAATCCELPTWTIPMTGSPPADDKGGDEEGQVSVTTPNSRVTEQCRALSGGWRAGEDVGQRGKSQLSCWTIDAECRLLGADCCMVGAQCCRVLGARCGGAECWVLGTGYWVSRIGCWVLDAESRV